jgi:glucose-1-phosphate thymidylyltransferase
MRGVLLAGGNGTRLLPLTKVTNKHLLPVYDKPMIEYPLQTLVELGCDDILIITGGEHIGDFAAYLGDGSQYGVRLTYRVQPDAGGVAQALGCAEGFTDHNLFPVILGDNYFEQPMRLTEPGIIVHETKDANRFGVYDSKTNQIIEKPDSPKSNLAVTGLYWYDSKVFPLIRRLVPSSRGELEITDINNQILKNGGQVRTNNARWSDMGTFNSLLETTKYIEAQNG